MEPDAERERQDVNVPLIKEPKMSAHFDTTVWKGLKGGKRVITGPPSRSPIRSPTRIEADVQVCTPARVGVSVAVIKGHALRPSPHVSTRMKNFLPFRLFPTPSGSTRPPSLNHPRGPATPARAFIGPVAHSAVIEHLNAVTVNRNTLRPVVPMTGSFRQVRTHADLFVCVANPTRQSGAAKAWRKDTDARVSDTRIVDIHRCVIR